jgi:predicted DNA-binding protein
MGKKLVTISAQIPSDLLDSLEVLCKEYERSKSYFIRKAIEYFLENDFSKNQDVEDNNKKIVKK